MSKWRSIQLGEVAEFVRGINFKPEDVVPVGTSGSVACMRTKNVQADLDVSDVWGVAESFVRRQEQVLRHGDILVSSANSWNLVGKCCWIPALPWRASFGGFVSVLRPDRALVDPRFLYRWFASDRIQTTVRSFGQQTTNISNLNIGRCLKLPIPIPPLPEQRRIAEVLDRAEALRAKRRAALAQLDTLPKAFFLGLLRQAGQSVSTVSIEDGMEVIIDYRGRSPNKAESGVPLVTARVVKGGELLEPNEFIAEKDYDSWMRRGFPQPGDVLFTTEAPLGEVAQLDGRKVALAQRLLVLRGKSSLLDNTFLKHALTAQEVRKQIDARATGSTVRGIRQRELRKVMIPVPSLVLQRDFASRVAAVEKLKTAHRASLASLDELFASLQHRAFRGEL